MGGTPASGRVRAKTGTLEDVTALSGFAESLGGRHYAFSILVNDFPDTLRQAMGAEDALAVALASFGGPSIPSLLVRPEPSEALPAPDDRLARYGSLATARDPANAPYLRLAVQNERSQDLRAVAAEALYRSEPDEAEAVDALLEVLPDDAAAFEAQRLAGRKAGIAVILWEAFVDLASDGDGRGMAGLMALAPFADALAEETPAIAQPPLLNGPPAPAPGVDADDTVDDRRTRAAGMVEVAREAPLELLDAMAQSPAKERDPAVALLLFGLKAEPEAAQGFAIQATEVAKESNNSPVRAFAAQLVKLLPPVKLQ
jgi:serine-type D-Ala-D-Ala carboxypeptidase/endopeptidase (penicillin-binding protein 4)